MKKQRVRQDEILQAVRSSGFASMEEVLGVVLETTGEFSVLSKDSSYPKKSTLKNISKDSFNK
ncbi:MAG: DUF421 domain-containing protein [Pisciglobus halotolerans]|nr:DUF421 domain-containing protein [Pisciglobus halotolerans]